MPHDTQIQKTEELLSAYRATFGTDHGQLVLNDLMSKFAIFDSTISFLPNKNIDPLEISFSEGQRTVVLNIMQHVQVGQDPKSYLKKLEEYRKKLRDNEE